MHPTRLRSQIAALAAALLCLLPTVAVAEVVSAAPPCPASVHKPAAGTTRYPCATQPLGRSGSAEDTDGSKLYVRALDSSEAAIALILTDTAGTVLSASASTDFPTASSWKQVSCTGTGICDFELAIASTTTAGPARLEYGWRAGSVPQTRKVPLVILDAPTGAAGVAAVQADTDDIQLSIGTIAGTDLVTRLANVYSRQGAPAGASHAADLVVIDNFVDDLEANVAIVDGIVDSILLAVDTAEASLASLSAALALVGDALNDVLADTGDGTDAIVLAGSAGSLHAHLRGVQAAVGTPTGSWTIAEFAAQTYSGIVLDGGTVDGAFADTDTIFECSSLSGTIDYFGAAAARVIVRNQADGKAAVRTLASYDTGTKRITLSAAAPWTISNGDTFAVIPL